MKKLRLQSESGFTLIELLVVVAIIGILAAIAIPQFAAYRKRGHEAQIKSDLRNAAVAQEAYFAQYTTYTPTGAINATTAPGFNPTTGVTTTTTRGSNAFTLLATHTNCTGVSWSFVSTTGVINGPAGGCP